MIGLDAVRSELARQLWLARKSKLDLIEAQEKISELVSNCPENIIDIAINVEHLVKNQIQKIMGNHYYRCRGLSKKNNVSKKIRKEIELKIN